MDSQRVREVWRPVAEGAGVPEPPWLRPGVPTFAGVAPARRAEELAGAAAVVVGIPWERLGAQSCAAALGRRWYTVADVEVVAGLAQQLPDGQGAGALTP